MVLSLLFTYSHMLLESLYLIPISTDEPYWDLKGTTLGAKNGPAGFGDLTPYHPESRHITRPPSIVDQIFADRMNLERMDSSLSGLLCPTKSSPPPSFSPIHSTPFSSSSHLLHVAAGPPARPDSCASGIVVFGFSNLSRPDRRSQLLCGV